MPQGASPTTPPLASDFPQEQTWRIQQVDAPKVFHNMRDRSLRLDAAGHPHIVYGQDHLYHAWHDGSSWRIETVDTAWGVGMYASLALDGAGFPHIAYYDWNNFDLKYARWTGSAWTISTVNSA
ncbi:MAG: hypothetical protein FJ011_22020, partial [Chloroflexi bacterium]|nr:hypothetical protein [Chloroflexota bacterium]